MTAITHHPDDATLMSYAAGSLSEALTAVVAAHLGLCGCCQCEIRKMEALGAIMLSSAAPSGIGRAGPVSRAPSETREPDGTASTTPTVMDRLLGCCVDDIAWKRIGFGLWYRPIELSKSAKGVLRLLKVEPGGAIPEHGHHGAELTMTLRGSYRDKYGEFRAGDVSDLDQEVEHRPMACSKEGCVCLVASEGKIKFRGLIGRIAGPLSGW